MFLQYDGVKMIDDSNATKNLAVWTMVTITGALPKNKNVLSMAELDIVLIIDTSDSMMGNRLSTMKNLIRHLINSTLMENHRLGKLFVVLYYVQDCSMVLSAFFFAFKIYINSILRKYPLS